MHCTRKITSDITFIGANDRRLAMFENAYPLFNGVSYNSYLINDEKTVLLDTVDKSVSSRFFENLEYALNGRKLDFVVVSHMEPDHCSTLDELIIRYPDVTIIVNPKTIEIIKQFFYFDIDSKSFVVNNGDTLCIGSHILSFYTAPMVHWPEVMVTYDSKDKVLFSADAFGTFGALNGNIFSDETNFETYSLSEARRYYSNIVGKYGAQVTALLNKISLLDINYICPLHGPIWRDNIKWFINKYKKWASWQPEDSGVVIAFGSIYGNTENAADILAIKLAEKGVKNIVIYDVSKTHPSFILSDAFRYSHLVFASSTYNGGIFPYMETLLLDIKAHLLKNRTLAFIENGTWAPLSGKLMKEIVSSLKNMTIIENTVTIRSSLKDEQEDELNILAERILDTIV